MRRMVRSLVHRKPGSAAAWLAATLADGEGSIDASVFEMHMHEFIARGWVGPNDLVTRWP